MANKTILKIQLTDDSEQCVGDYEDTLYKIDNDALRDMTRSELHEAISIAETFSSRAEPLLDAKRQELFRASGDI